MTISTQLAKNFRTVCHGGNWTSVNLRSVVQELTVQQANHSIADGNSILTILFHLHYYMQIQTDFLKGKGLHGTDAQSFIHPQIQIQEDLNEWINQFFMDAEALAVLIENLNDTIWEEPFADTKYGSYFRNISGMIEHLHYHLGQMVILKKLV